MSYKERTTLATLIAFILILVFYLFRLSQIIQENGFITTGIYRLWGIVIVLGVLLNILAVILTQIASAIVLKVRSNEELQSIEDERDRLIELRGTRVAYVAFSLGVLISMLTMVLDQPPLVMFSLIIFFSLAASIAGDLARLFMYRRGF